MSLKAVDAPLPTDRQPAVAPFEPMHSAWEEATLQFQLLHELSHEDILLGIHCISGLVREERNQRLDGEAGFILRRWLRRKVAARRRMRSRYR